VAPINAGFEIPFDSPCLLVNVHLEF
jgi:hypothetical protein